MKKIAMFGIGIVSMCMVSCGGSTKSETVDADSVSVETTDTTNIVSDLDKVTAALESGNSKDAEAEVKKLQEKIQQLAESGDTETAKAYALQLQQWFDKNKEKVEEAAKNGATIGQLVDAVKNLPSTIVDNANDAADAAKADAETIKEATKQQAEEAKQAAVEEAESKVNEATEKVTEKANEAVSNATKKAAQKLLGN